MYMKISIFIGHMRNITIWKYYKYLVLIIMLWYIKYVQKILSYLIRNIILFLIYLPVI